MTKPHALRSWCSGERFICRCTEMQAANSLGRLGTVSHTERQDKLFPLGLLKNSAPSDANLNLSLSSRGDDRTRLISAPG